MYPTGSPVSALRISIRNWRFIGSGMIVSMIVSVMVVVGVSVVVVTSAVICVLVKVSVVVVGSVVVVESVMVTSPAVNVVVVVDWGGLRQ